MPENVPSAVRAALVDLIDYAGLFPPAALSMEDAVRGYAAANASAHAWILGRFIVPATRLPELCIAAGAGIPRISAILDGGSDPLRWFANLQIALDGVSGAAEVQTLEVPLPRLASARETYGAQIGQLATALGRAGLDHRPVYVELPRDARWLSSLDDAMTSLDRHGLYAKVRCGGERADAYPTCEELAAFVIAAARAGIAFKATAGLHHPVRAFNAQAGVVMHGFLNLMAASLLALHEDDPAGVEHALGEEDAGAFALTGEYFSWREHRYDAVALTHLRANGFAAYGSCSFDEPVDDLLAMGVLHAGPA